MDPKACDRVGRRPLVKRTVPRFFGIAVAAMLIVSSSLAQELTGKPRVIDGDTLEIAGVAIRFAGMDAPPIDAICGLPGQEWRCGQEAMFALALAVAEHWVTCQPQGHDSDGILVARCRAGPYDLAEQMVGDGWAMAVDMYGFAESVAKREGLGIWRNSYTPPPGWVPLDRR